MGLKSRGKGRREKQVGSGVKGRGGGGGEERGQ